jgi:uroporphyrinogen decarboxylase
MINNTEWISTLLSSKRRYAIPIMTHPGIELIRKTVRDAVTIGDIHYQAIEALNKKYIADAITIIMDLTVEAEAFGCELNFTENEVPAVVSSIVNDALSIETLKVPDLNVGRIQEYLKAARLAALNIKNKPVFAGCIGPISLAGRLFGLSDLMMALFIEPHEMECLIKKCTEFIEKYILAFKKTGVNGIIIAEPAAGLLSKDLCDRFSSVYVKEIVSKFQDENFMVILHNCGNTGHVTQSMVSTGAKGLHFGNAINMAKVLEEIPSDIIAMGNLDPVNVFKMKTPEELYFSTSELLQNTQKYSNFVISSGCDTPPNVPFANIDAFYKAVSDYNLS